MINNVKDAMKMVCKNFEGYSNEDCLAGRVLLDAKAKEVSAEASQYKEAKKTIEDHLANTLDETEQVSFTFDDVVLSSSFKSTDIKEIKDLNKLLVIGLKKDKKWISTVVDQKLLLNMINDGTETDQDVLDLIETRTVSQLKFSSKKAKK